MCHTCGVILVASARLKAQDVANWSEGRRSLLNHGKEVVRVVEVPIGDTQLLIVTLLILLEVEIGAHTLIVASVIMRRL